MILAALVLALMAGSPASLIVSVKLVIVSPGTASGRMPTASSRSASPFNAPTASVPAGTPGGGGTVTTAAGVSVATFFWCHQPTLSMVTPVALMPSPGMA